MLQLESSRALSFRLAQIAEGRKLGFGRCAPFEQMQQGRDRGGDEPQQRHRKEERHASFRNTMPNGMSERMWWYAMPWLRHALRHAGDLSLYGRRICASQLAGTHQDGGGRLGIPESHLGRTGKLHLRPVHQMNHHYLMSAMTQETQCRQRLIPIEQQIGDQHDQAAPREQRGHLSHCSLGGGPPAIGRVQQGAH